MHATDRMNKMSKITASELEVLSNIIENRHTTKPAKMNGREIENHQIETLLALADHAPTHGRTEPWRFIVYSGAAFQEFCQDHAAMYQEKSSSFKENKYELLKSHADHASHLVIVYLKRTIQSKIPAQEEYAACCAAVQNLLLGASAMGLSAIWSTGGMAYSDGMKQYLGLDEEDQVVAFLYLGYSDEQPKPRDRKISWRDKSVFKE